MIVRPCPTLSSLWCALSLGLLSGCASESDAVEKRLSQLREEIRKLQNDTDRVSERLEAVELRQARAEAAQNAPRAVASSETVSRPRLKVLHLSPGEGDATPASGAAPAGGEEQGPPMILKGQGKDLELKQGSGGPSSRAPAREKSVAVSQNEVPAPSGGSQ